MEKASGLRLERINEMPVDDEIHLIIHSNNKGSRYKASIRSKVIHQISITLGP